MCSVVQGLEGDLPGYYQLLVYLEELRCPEWNGRLILLCRNIRMIQS
jgi:hypothetical protein